MPCSSHDFLHMNDPLLAVRDPLLRGDFQTAADTLEGHLAAFPEDARAWGLLGKCRRELNQLQAAERALGESLRLAPALTASRRELALLRRDQGDQRGALDALLPLLQGAPGDVSLLWEVALLQAKLTPADALPTLQRLRQLRPDDIQPALLQAKVLLRCERFAEAEASASAILAREPDHLGALESAYLALSAQNLQPHRRLALKRRIAELAPSSENLLELVHEQIGVGDYAAVQHTVAQALEQDPGDLAARWAAFQLPSAPAPDSLAAAEAFRRQWSDGLAYFEAVDFSRDEHRRQVWSCVGQATAFYRHYLDDAPDEQRRYGALVARMMAELDPGIGARALRRQRRRIGFFGTNFWLHTVARLFGPLIEALAEHDFDLEVFSLDAPRDGWRERLNAVSTLHCGPMSGPKWRELIVARELDVLVYLEIGMHPMSAGMAALRLAPVQAALWGHPVSSGLPTLDYQLVPDAMEPADAQDHYSERLIRLPGLGHGLRADHLPAPEPVDLGQPDDLGTALLCAQTVFKLMPEQDVLFARILAGLPDACLHLLADNRQFVRDWLHARLAPVLVAHGVDPTRRLRIHGFLSLPQFLGLGGACQLNLDTIGWSGGMSALDLLGQGLPTLTIEGPRMRTRQTAALLRRLEAPELIARDADDYVERAIDLAQRPEQLAALRQRILAHRQRLFADPATVDALARFLREVEV